MLQKGDPGDDIQELINSTGTHYRINFLSISIPTMPYSIMACSSGNAFFVMRHGRFVPNGYWLSLQMLVIAAHMRRKSSRANIYNTLFFLL